MLFGKVGNFKALENSTLSNNLGKEVGVQLYQKLVSICRKLFLWP